MTLKTLVISLFALGVAVALITYVVAMRREAAVAVTFPALGAILTVDGVKLHALTRGSGPDVVLIHGASGNLRDMLPLVDALASRYRVTAFDRPGLGWSDPIADSASLTAQALHLARGAAQLGISDPIVVGQSYGGAVALGWALDAPLHPRALVLISAPSLPWPGKLDPWYRLTDSWFGQWVAIPLVAAFVPQSYIDRAVTGIFAPDAAPANYLTYIGAGLSIRRQTLRINSDQVNALRGQIVTQGARYSELTLPVELIHGSADTIVPLTIHSQPLSAMLPAAHLTVLPGTGHMPHHAQLQAVLDAIDRAAARSQLP